MQKICDMCSKISGNIGLLIVFKYFLLLTLMKKLYYTILHLHMVYGIEMRGSFCRPQLALLRRRMNKYLKAVTSDVFNIENNKSKFLYFDQLYKHCLTSYFKYTSWHHWCFQRLILYILDPMWNKKLNYPSVVCFIY